MDIKDSRFNRRRAAQILIGGCAIPAVQTASGKQLEEDAGPPSRRLYADGFQRSEPEAQGIASSSILNLLAELEKEKLELNSFMLYRHGHVVAEGWWSPYRPELVHMMHSLTKSVTVCAIGWAIAENHLKLTDKVVSFYPEYLPPVISDNLAEMTVEDLLTMRSGHDHQTSGSEWRPIRTSWVAEFYKLPVVYKPGTTWVYNSASTYMLSAILSKVTGSSTYEYLKPRLFSPLGIHGEEWAPGPQDITPGANGLSWHTSDSLKLGVLYLQNGKWNGRQILPVGWAEECHKQHVAGQYGYQWWLGPQDSYYADGMFGQYSMVFPNHDAVFACTSAVHGPTFNKILNQHFPAAFEAARVPNFPSVARKLHQKLASLHLLPPLVVTHSPIGATISGRTFFCEANEDEVQSIRLDISESYCLFNMRDDRGDHEVKCGFADYTETFTTITGDKLHHEYQPDVMRVVAGATWIDPNTLMLVWQFTESAFRDTVICKIDGAKLTFDRSVNVNSAALKRPTITGRLSI
jgi:CubicO group peptidase (beta-lactamase class C family)